MADNLRDRVNPRTDHELGLLPRVRNEERSSHGASLGENLTKHVERNDLEKAIRQYGLLEVGNTA
jgi:hypothetical protein